MHLTTTFFVCSMQRAVHVEEDLTAVAQLKLNACGVVGVAQQHAQMAARSQVRSDGATKVGTHLGLRFKARTRVTTRAGTRARLRARRWLYTPPASAPCLSVHGSSRHANRAYGAQQGVEVRRWQWLLGGHCVCGP